MARWKASPGLAPMLAAVAAKAPDVIIPAELCFTDGFSVELCCNGKGRHYGCWDGIYTEERCCRGKSTVSWEAFAYDMTDFDFSRCSEFVRQFDWQAVMSNTAKYAAPATQKYSGCIELRRLDAGSARPSAITGVHHPTLIAPTSGMRYAVLPAWDLVDADAMRKVGTADMDELTVYRALTTAGSVFVDVGAHLGAFTVPMAEHLGLSGAVVAWEPFRAVFQLLVANVALNGLANVFPRHAALSERASRIRVRSPSLKEVVHLGRARVFDQEPVAAAYANYLAYDGEETVAVEALDDFDWRDVASENASLVLKVDTEGHNLPLIRGARETLRSKRPVVMIEDAEDGWQEEIASLGYGCRLLLPRTKMCLCLPEEAPGPDLARRLAEALRCATRRASLPPTSLDLVPCRVLEQILA